MLIIGSRWLPIIYPLRIFLSLGPERKKVRVILRRAPEQLRDFVLHVLELVEAQTGIGHDEHVTGRAVLIY